MCILRYHAQAGYVQTYETLLKEINSHTGSDEVQADQALSMHWSVLHFLTVTVISMSPASLASVILRS
jgi:hypothetical protein